MASDAHITYMELDRTIRHDKSVMLILQYSVPWKKKAKYKKPPEESCSC